MTERSSVPDAGVTPEVVASFRSQLTGGEDVVDPTTWAGSVPVARGIAPRVRIGRSRWFNLLWLLPIGFVVLISSPPLRVCGI
jgi:sulfoxide reductase catalytic subunit YedY